jgi:type I restriction enzyme R subunit
MRTFTSEQTKWLEIIHDHVAANPSIEIDDFDYSPFAQNGGLGKLHMVFGENYARILEELSEAPAA